MPQIMVDTTTDTVDSLRRLATFLQDEADSREEYTAKLLEDKSPVPAGTSDGVPKFIKDAIEVMKGTQDIQYDTDTNIDTAVIFAKKPAGLDGHGEAPLAPAAPVSGVTALAASPPNAPEPKTAATVTVPVGTVVLDSSGIPHDVRIHQETRKLNKNGTWQNRRGIDKDLLAAVTAELKAMWGKPAAAPAPAASAVPVAPPPPPAIPAAAPLAPQPPPVASGPAPVAPANPGAPGAILGFRELMQKITVNTNAGKLTNEQVDAALASVGLPPRQLIGLVNQQALIPEVSAYLDACLAAA